MDGVDVALDGRKPSTVQREKDALHVTVPSDAGARDLVLEAWFTIPGENLLGTGLETRLRAPSLQGVSHVRTVYWQVCLPADRHLLADPDGFVPEMQYSWQSWFWDRRGTLSQRNLEKWSGASAQEALPAQTNQYLYSGFGTPDVLPLVTFPRRIILAVAGGLVLGLGLLLLHVSWMRHPAVVMLLAVALAGASLNWPSSALLLSQAAGLALAVVGLAALWQWGTSGRPAWPHDTSRPPSAIRERPSTAAAAAPPRVESVVPSSTATAPLVGATEARP
jgi:hypothetical protein